MNIKDFISDALHLKPHFDKIDLGVLNVAFMIAALDGEVTAEEYEAFDLIARKCRGYTIVTADAALREAMRSAGYLLLFGKRANDEQFAQEFIAEAMKALPESFPFYDIEDVRWAFEMWMSVAKSDGEYSKRERICLEALKRYITEIRKNEVAWLTYSTTLRI